MNPTDRILKIGKKLEKMGLSAFQMKTPSGQPAYFRSYGLQIIPSEAEEIDTGHSCRLMITPHAAQLSAFVEEVLKVLLGLPSGKSRAVSLVSEMKSMRFNASRRVEGWETIAAKDVVTSALKIAVQRYEKSSLTAPHEAEQIDPFTGETLEQRRRYWDRARDALMRGSEVMDSATGSSPQSGREPVVKCPESSPVWREVLGHLGAVIGGYWIPIGDMENMSSSSAQIRLVKALRCRGLKPDLALTIVANAQKRGKRPGQ
jgi:hypothetical protein